MKKGSFISQLWIAFKIWILAVVINSLGGAMYLCGFSPLDECWTYLIVGCLFSLVFSFRIFVALCIIINRCVYRNVHPTRIFVYVFCSGILLTVIFFLLFDYSLGIVEVIFPLFSCALLSSVIATASQFRYIRRLNSPN